MNKKINIGIVGLGQIGIYLYKELNLKKKDIEKKTGKIIKIVAISAKNKNKKRRFPISKKRIQEDMGYKLSLVSTTKRLEWIKSKFDAKKVIYMGDGIFDHLVMKKVLYSIAPNGCLDHVSKTANFKTKNYPGNRAVAEAVIHILKHFFGIDFVKLREFNI